MYLEKYRHADKTPRILVFLGAAGTMDRSAGIKVFG
jgi:hypothetical protein